MATETGFSAGSARIRRAMTGFAFARLPTHRLQIGSVEVGRGGIAVPVVIVHLQTVGCRRWQTIFQVTARRQKQHDEKKKRSNRD